MQIPKSTCFQFLEAFLIGASSRFCRKVNDAKIKIKASGYPMCLYNEDHPDFKSGTVFGGLMYSRVLIEVRLLSSLHQYITNR